MSKMRIPIFLLVFLLLSCQFSKKNSNELNIAKAYYNVLNNSDFSIISNWFGDSLTTIEGKYTNTYSQEDYIEFLKWDAVFDPSYSILSMEEQDGLVTAKISKIDKRIAFLHEEPFITYQTLKIDNGKVISVETQYVDFKETIWTKNRTELLDWIDKTHPELNGFIYDQTEAGAKKFLKAIELYTNKM